MRSVLSISLPKAKKIEIERRAKKAGKKISTYILEIIDLQEDLISEDELLQIAEEGEREYREGKTKVLHSLKDLMED